MGSIMDIHRITWDLMRCTTHLSQHLNKERHFWKFSCLENIEDKAEWAYNYIDTNNDIETAFTLAKLDRSLWHRMLNDPNLETEDFMMLKSVAKTLFEIHNWYLKEAYHIQDEAIMKCEYYLNTITGEVRNSKTQEVLQATKKPTGLPKELCTKNAQKAFAKAIEKGLMEHDGIGYKWIATNSLYGYFIDKLSDKLELKTSNDRIQWKLFEEIVTNHGSIVGTARQAVNDYKNNGMNPPEGDYIVDDILKDL